MPRPVTQNRLILNENCNSNSTLEISLRDGRAFYLSTTDYDLEVPGAAQTYRQGLIHTNEVEDNLGAATSGVSVKVANSYAGQNNFWSILAAQDDRILEYADVVIRNFRRNGEKDYTIWSHDHYFTGQIVKAEPKESKSENENAVVITRTVDFEIVLDTTAAGVCLATDALTPANGFIFPEATDVSVIPSSGGGTVGGGTIGGTGEVNDTLPCFVAGTLIATPNGDVAIENIKPGDAVCSFNADTLEIETDSVVEVFRHTAKEYLEIVFSDFREISVTKEHPFLIAPGMFQAAGSLAPGRNVFILADEKLCPAARLDYRTVIEQKTEVFNFHVRRNQTYIANGFAVHNRKYEGDLIAGGNTY